jgi:hypothetical protein
MRRQYIRVVGETEREKPLATSMAQCPECHDKQLIYSDRILSINVERNTKSAASERQPE